MFKVEKMDLLVSLYIFCIAVAETMGSKTFVLLDFVLPYIGSIKLNASVAIFVIPIIFTINDIITEVHGAARARSVVRSGLFVIVLIFLFSLLAVHLPASPRFLNLESSYDAIFSKAAQISFASLVAFGLADFLDIFVFSKIRAKLGKKNLWLRNNVSNFIAQLIDTTVFMTLAFYALDKGFDENVGFLFSLILPYWLLKCSMSIIETPFVYAGVRWLKKE